MKMNKTLENTKLYLNDHRSWLECSLNGPVENVHICVLPLPADCCFCELALLKSPTKYVPLVQSRYHHHLIKCNLFNHDIAEKLLIWH
jgi:hypothetical protein